MKARALRLAFLVLMIVLILIPAAYAEGEDPVSSAEDDPIVQEGEPEVSPVPANRAEEEDKTIYRALVLGVEAYKSPLYGCVPDAQRVSAMLQAANEGGAFYQAPNLSIDTSASQIKSAFSGTAEWGVDENDVTFIFYSGAALLNDAGTDVGLIGADGQILPLSEIEGAVSALPGAKILFFNCVYPEGRIRNTGASEREALNKLNELIINRFKGTGAQQEGSEQLVICFTSSSNTNDIVNSVSGQSFNLPIYFATQALGYDYQNERPCNLLADANVDGSVSVSELVSYVDKKMDSFFTVGGLNDLIIVGAGSPMDSHYPVLARRTSTQVSSITLSQSEAELPVEKGLRLTVDLLPQNASDKSLIWTSSDLAVASVDQQGNIKALRAGESVITATSANGLSASCKLMVRALRKAESITMKRESVVLLTEGEAQLEYETVPANINEPIVWRSSDADVATVSQAGLVKAVGEGEATITLTTESGLSAKTELTVAKRGTVVESIDIKDHAVSLFEGDKKQLEFRTNPANPPDKTVIWASSDESIASVTQSGQVTALKQGSCTVSVTAVSGVSSECLVTVRGTVVDLKASQFSMVIGRSEKLDYRLIPDGSKVNITWTSEDESIATVDSEGRVTAIGIGDTVVTATLDSGSKASCAIHVTYVEITSVKLDKKSLTMSLGQVATVKSRVEPDLASNQSLSWTSSNPQVVTVDEKGAITAVGEGRADVTAAAQSGKSATVKIEVKPIAVTKVTLDKKELKLTMAVASGSSAQLTATTSPENANERGVTWTSSDPSVATVSDTGLVQAVTDGKAIIRAASMDGKKFAECRVTVEPNRVAYDKARTGSAKKLYVSAKRIYYKEQALVAELYFVNKTGENMLIPLAGSLILQWEDGTEVELMAISQGDVKLGKGKTTELTVSIDLTAAGNESLAALDLREAKATIRTPEEEAAQQQLAVPETSVDPDVLPSREPEPSAEPSPAPESDFVDELIN